MVENSSWPGRTCTFSVTAAHSFFRLFRSVSQLPPGRSVRPTSPANSVSPLNSRPPHSRQTDPALWPGVAGLIAEMHLPCYAISARQLADGRATMALTIGVNNTEHLNTVIARLRKIKSITTITRV